MWNNGTQKQPLFPSLVLLTAGVLCLLLAHQSWAHGDEAQTFALENKKIDTCDGKRARANVALNKLLEENPKELRLSGKVYHVSRSAQAGGGYTYSFTTLDSHPTERKDVVDFFAGCVGVNSHTAANILYNPRASQTDIQASAEVANEIKQATRLLAEGMSDLSGKPANVAASTRVDKAESPLHSSADASSASSMTSPTNNKIAN